MDKIELAKAISDYQKGLKRYMTLQNSNGSSYIKIGHLVLVEFCNVSLSNPTATAVMRNTRYSTRSTLKKVQCRTSPFTFTAHANKSQLVSLAVMLREKKPVAVLFPDGSELTMKCRIKAADRVKDSDLVTVTLEPINKKIRYTGAV